MESPSLSSPLLNKVKSKEDSFISQRETALILNGVNQYAEIPEITGTPLAVGYGPFTVEMEIKLSNKQQSSVDPHLFRFGRHSKSQDAVIALDGDKIKFGCCSVGWDYTRKDYSLTDDQWHHIAYVRDRDLQTLYVDGIEKGSSHQFNPNITAGQLRIGAVTSNLPYSLGEQLSLFSGYIRNVAFWATARSASQIQKDLSRSRISFNNLVAYWEFNDRDSMRVYDQSGNDYDLTLVNSPSQVRTPGNQDYLKDSQPSLKETLADGSLMALPPEILVHILSYSDVSSIVNFRLINWEAYNLTQEDSLISRIRLRYGIPITNRKTALILNGINQYAEISEIKGTPFAVGYGPFTVEMEIKVTDERQSSVDPHLFRFGRHSQSQDAVIALDGDRVKSGCCSVGWGYTRKDYSLTNDQWHHIAYVRNGNLQTLYVNGVEKGRSTQFNPNITAGQLRIGAVTTTPSHCHGNQLFLICGHLRNVAFWATARNASQIQKDLSKSRISSNSLVAYWAFNDGDSTRALDSSGHNYNLTLVNSPTYLNIQ